MDGLKLVALVLLIAGFLGLVYGGFTYTKDTHEADLGPLHLAVAEKEHVNVPVWAGASAMLIGGVLLVMKRKN